MKYEIARDEVRISGFRLVAPPAAADRSCKRLGRFDPNLLRCLGSKPCFVGVQICWRTALSCEEGVELTECQWSKGQQGQGSQFQCLKVPDVPDPAWKAGFVSKSDSYKTSIGSEEAKQTRQASRQRQIKGHPRYL